MSDEADTFNLVAGVAMGWYNAVSTATAIAKKVQPDLEPRLQTLWKEIIDVAKGGPRGNEMLVELTVALSKLPDVTNEQGPIILYDQIVWRDLPMLGWEVNSLWNSRSPSDDEKYFINGAQFVAMLINTDESVFQPFRLQILWTFRTLEDKQPCDIPAIAAIVSVLDTKIATWEDEYGAPGRGGALWNGKKGFSPERYALWKKRLAEIDEQSPFQKLAEETAAKM